VAHSFDEPDPIDSGTLRLLQAAVARLPAGVALVEAPSGRVLLRNEQASLIFKRDPAREAVGETGDYGPFVGYKADGRPYSAEEWPLARTVRTGEVVAAEDAEIVRADGTHGFIRMSSAPVRAADGRIVAGLMTFHDITDAKRTERDRAFLAHAGVLLGESLEPDEILRRLARLAVPDVADWCVVHTLDGGRVHAVALEHRDASIPDVPTFREQGYDVVTAGSVKGIAVPKGTPKDIISYLDGKCRDISKDAEFASIMKQIGQPIDYMPAAEYTVWFKGAYDQFGTLLKTLNIETK
jgi:hypothetical protein